MIVQTTTRDRILDAAMALVREQGVAKLTLDEAARCAGVSKGGVLYHFRSKDDLVRGMVQRMIDQCEALHQAYYDAEPPGPNRWARTVVRAVFDPTGPVHDPIGTAMLAASAVNPELIEPLREKYAEWTERVKSDSPDFERARIVCMAMDGYVLQQMLGLRTYTHEQLEQVKQAALDMLR